MAVMTTTQTQSLVAAIGVLGFLLLSVLPSTSSAFILERRRNDLDSYDDGYRNGAERLAEWKRNVPLLRRLLGSLYIADQDSVDIQESSIQEPSPSENRLTSQQEQALREMLVRFLTTKALKSDPMIPEVEGEELTSSEDGGRLLTSKRGGFHTFSGVAPIRELCRMVGLRRCH